MAASNSGAAHQARIISHMNGDHQRELSHYLRHYCGLSSSAAADAHMTDISLKSMTIKSHSGEYSVPFDPPLAAWSDVRPRVVDMDRVAREHLGISDIYITAFAPPRGSDFIVFGGVVFYFVCFFSLPWIQPGTGVWDLLTSIFPGGPQWYRWVVKTIFIPVLAIHVGEAYWFHRSRMVPHGVQPGSTLWWKWESSTFFEGFRAFKRIDGIIAAKRAEKEARRH